MYSRWWVDGRGIKDKVGQTGWVREARFVEDERSAIVKIAHQQRFSQGRDERETEKRPDRRGSGLGKMTGNLHSWRRDEKREVTEAIGRRERGVRESKERTTIQYRGRQER
jgi:hypothetical protein